MKHHARSPKKRKAPTLLAGMSYEEEARWWQKHRPEWDDGADGYVVLPGGELQRDLRVACKTRLEAFRRASGLTQTKLGQLSGVPATAISAIEHGRLKMGLSRAQKLAMVLGVKFHALLPEMKAASPKRRTT
jgi:DNA-binding XRE family transcriptional regulator